MENILTFEKKEINVGVIVNDNFFSRNPNDLQDEYDFAVTDVLKAIGSNYYLKNGETMPLEKVLLMKKREYESYTSLCNLINSHKSIEFQPATFHDFVLGFPIFSKETIIKITDMETK